MQSRRVELPIVGTGGPNGRDRGSGGSGAGGAGRPRARPRSELTGAGQLAAPGAVRAGLDMPGLAPGAGYRAGGPLPPAGPVGAPGETSYDGAVPVFQWEIDPLDASLAGGEAELERDGWDYRCWWREHPARLVYAAMQASPCLPPVVADHPLGRAVAVNLVYDVTRRAVVAIYGTARDFRPFVSVFAELYGRSAIDSADHAARETNGAEVMAGAAAAGAGRPDGATLEAASEGRGEAS